MYAVETVIRARRDEFDGICAKDRHVAHILIPSGQVPAIIGIGLVAIADLVAAQRIVGLCGEADRLCQRHLAARHREVAQQIAHPKE